MIRFSHSANSWQVHYINESSNTYTWMNISVVQARFFAERNSTIVI